MEADGVTRSAVRTLHAHGVYGISVEGVMDQTVLEACRSSERLANYRQIRLSTFGRLRQGGFVLLASFEHPHFTIVLSDLSVVTVTRLRNCFNEAIPNPAVTQRW